MTDKQVYDLTKYLFESWERGADYDNYHMDSMLVLEALAQSQWVGLTEDEISSCDPSEEIWGLFEIARKLEAKLKEKNA